MARAGPHNGKDQLQESQGGGRGKWGLGCLAFVLPFLHSSAPTEGPRPPSCWSLLSPPLFLGVPPQAHPVRPFPTPNLYALNTALVLFGCLLHPQSFSWAPLCFLHLVEFQARPASLGYWVHHSISASAFTSPSPLCLHSSYEPRTIPRPCSDAACTRMLSLNLPLLPQPSHLPCPGGGHSTSNTGDTMDYNSVSLLPVCDQGVSLYTLIKPGS